MLGKKGRYEAFFFVDFILERWVLICDMFLTFDRRLSYNQQSTLLGGLLTCTLQTGFQQWACDVFSSHCRGTSNNSRQMQKWTWFGSWDAVIFILVAVEVGFLIGPLDFTTKDTTLPNTGRSVRVSSCRGRGLLPKVKGQNSRNLQ